MHDMVSFLVLQVYILLYCLIFTIKVDRDLIHWLRSNSGASFESPRRDIFKTRAQDFRIIDVDEEREIVRIQFNQNKTVLRLEFWRFDTAMDVLNTNNGEWIRLGTSFYPHDAETLEYQIQQKAKAIYPNRNVDTKTAPHISDILVLSGIAEYGRALNPHTRRKNQAVRIFES